MLVDYIDHMGDDDRVANAARVSFDKLASLYSEEQNGRLLSYLARHGHWTPFSHPQITLRYTVPIFVARQEFKHIVGFTRNEVSRRYVDDEPEFFMPDTWRSRPDGSVKQGSGTEKLPEPSFKQGYCANCGKKTSEIVRKQGGGRSRKFCSDKCKYAHTNKYRNPYKTVFQNAEARVKREGVRKWSLDFDTMDFPEYCPYLGIKLDYSQGKGQIRFNSPSFDRIDPQGDYAPDNVEIVSNRANSMKNDASVEEQVKMAEAVLLKHRGYVPDYTRSYRGVVEKAKEVYHLMIEHGYSPEQARMVLPQSMYTSYYITGSLAAFARFFNQRTDEHAQKEIQDLAYMVGDIISPLYPKSWEALTNG